MNSVNNFLGTWHKTLNTRQTEGGEIPKKYRDFSKKVAIITGVAAGVFTAYAAWSCFKAVCLAGVAVTTGVLAYDVYKTFDKAHVRYQSLLRYNRFESFRTPRDTVEFLTQDTILLQHVVKYMMNNEDLSDRVSSVINKIVDKIKTMPWGARLF